MNFKHIAAGLIAPLLLLGAGAGSADAAETSSTESRTYKVTRVIDGDTVELAGGQDVRLVGIDTPERGECGYDKATAHMRTLVQGKKVTLTVSDEDQDRYGRLLRYVDVQLAGRRVDAGLNQIRSGFAIARYDSRDGYGFHQRQGAYIAADRQVKNVTCAPVTPPPPPPSGGGGKCHPGYSPCIPNVADLDCADVNGPIRVLGADPYRLDSDGDGWGCES